MELCDPSLTHRRSHPVDYFKMGKVLNGAAQGQCYGAWPTLLYLHARPNKIWKYSLFIWPRQAPTERHISISDKASERAKQRPSVSVCVDHESAAVWTKIVWHVISCHELKLTDNVKCDIAKHLSEKGVQLRRYFPKPDDTNNWICYPFHALPPVHLPISEQKSFNEIATSGSMKM